MTMLICNCSRVHSLREEIKNKCDCCNKDIKSPYKHPFQTLAFNKGFNKSRQEARKELIEDEINFIESLALVNREDILEHLVKRLDKLKSKNGVK